MWYTFEAYTRACLFWDGDSKTWSGEGCETSKETNDNETVCYCDHLTDFGGGGPPNEGKNVRLSLVSLSSVGRGKTNNF